MLGQHSSRIVVTMSVHLQLQGKQLDNESQSIPVTYRLDAFFVRSSSFVVSGPTPDGQLQVEVCEDIVRQQKMTPVFETTAEGRPEVATSVNFEGNAERVVLGTLKMSVPDAIALVHLLQQQIHKVEEAMAPFNAARARE